MNPVKRIVYSMLGLIGLSATSVAVLLMFGQFSYALGIMIAWGVIGLAFVCFLFLIGRRIKQHASECLPPMGETARDILKNKCDGNTYQLISQIVIDRDVDKFSNLVKLFSVDHAELWVFLYLFDNAPIKRKERKIILDLIKVVFKRRKDGLNLSMSGLYFFFLEMTPKFVPVSFYTSYLIYTLCSLREDWS